jgi:hypothetical protein
MPRGGARAGAGRPNGAHDRFRRRIKARETLVSRATRDALEFLHTSDQAIFEGDSVAFMISIYRNENLPLPIRMQAAAIAAPFERPKLTAVDARLLLEEQNRYVVPDAAERLIAELERLRLAQEQEQAEALVEKARTAFASIRQDRLPFEGGILPPQSTPASHR